MGNKKFGRIKKTLAVLLMLCFTLSITAASAEASDDSNGYNDGYYKGYDDGCNKGHDDGYNKGHDDGKIQGEKDCKQYGSKENLSKIPSPALKSDWDISYKTSYGEGYTKGYIEGYNKNRYSCLK